MRSLPATLYIAIKGIKESKGVKSEKNCVVLYKAGKFYSAYGDCGIIIHNLMGYKYVEYKHSAGFPESSIAEVKKALEDAKLPFMIYEK